eukprot:CAMPEP_0196657990 /NCGR_PEP_ID=MMETSP1086-20130531/26447_1 /TAXON_ID=77921 /ORGANISM="Cyanoptyche  gloeocystis , Strain SAG4.97" /LENGTH=248 /DNA_ID=CAMNT_0041991333 /DNA_START=148 /DNA_END=894 /DNA_ORIENTATION=+
MSACEVCSAPAQVNLDKDVRLDEVIDVLPSPVDSKPSRLLPVPEEPSRTVIVFDWDDTLLASTWLTAAGLKVDEPFELTESLKQDLTALENAVITLLNVASNHGTPVIITNAETGWVELSSSRFLPLLLPYLKELRVISARSTYEPAFPNAPMEWKLQAFTEEVKKTASLTGEAPLHILSVGDSHTEREACHAVGRTQSSYKVKSIKLIERPTIEQLRKQIELVTSHFSSICSYDGHLDLLLTTPLVC